MPSDANQNTLRRMIAEEADKDISVDRCVGRVSVFSIQNDEKAFTIQATEMRSDRTLSENAEASKESSIPSIGSVSGDLSIFEPGPPCTSQPWVNSVAGFDYGDVVAQVLAPFADETSRVCEERMIESVLSVNVPLMAGPFVPDSIAEDTVDSKAAAAQTINAPCFRSDRLQSQRLAVITSPAEFDVLFGRGKSNQNHPGNRDMRNIAGRYQSKYNAAGRDEKTNITRTIVETVKSNGGTFLKFNKDAGWVKVSDETARKKVAHVLRDGRSRPTAPKLDRHDFLEV